DVGNSRRKKKKAKKPAALLDRGPEIIAAESPQVSQDSNLSSASSLSGNDTSTEQVETSSSTPRPQHPTPNVWQGMFGWDALFRWEVFGVVGSGVFIAVGLAMLGVDWFPHNALISQACFAVAALLFVIKAIGHTITSAGRMLSKAIFCVVVN